MSATKRPLLIGQAPGPRTDPELPLYPWPNTSAGARLQRITGFDREEYLATFDRINLIRHHPGKTKKEDRFPIREARAAAQAIEMFARGRRLIFVGRKVAEAFGWPSSVLPFLKWEFNPKYGYSCAVVPHTSGLSRWYNDAQSMERAQTFWAEFRALQSRALPDTVDFYQKRRERLCRQSR